MADRPRIILIHALRESLGPSAQAFASGWPEAETFNLVDDSLSADLATEGALKSPMIERFLTLGRYAASSGPGERRSHGILFTCSAFGPAIEAVKRELKIPVLNPNEAAFEAALACGRRIGLIVTFAPSLAALETELKAMAQQRGIDLAFTGRIVEPALAALRAGDGATHDRLIAEAAAGMPPLDALILGQFSAARAAKAIAPVASRPVFTTPDAAVKKLKALVA